MLGSALWMGSGKTLTTTDRAQTEAAVRAVAAAVWDAAAPVLAGVRPAWADVEHDKRWRAGVAQAKQDARTAFGAALEAIAAAEQIEQRRETGGPEVGWRAVKPWNDVDTLLGQGLRVQERIVSPWFDLDDGTNGEGFTDGRVAFA